MFFVLNLQNGWFLIRIRSRISSRSCIYSGISILTHCQRSRLVAGRDLWLIRLVSSQCTNGNGSAEFSLRLSVVIKADGQSRLVSRDLEDRMLVLPIGIRCVLIVTDQGSSGVKARRVSPQGSNACVSLGASIHATQLHVVPMEFQ